MMQDKKEKSYMKKGDISDSDLYFELVEQFIIFVKGDNRWDT